MSKTLVKRSPMDQLIKIELDILKDTIINTIPVEQIILFSSYAYGTPHKDSDLYVVLKDDIKMREIDAIGRKQSMPVDIIVRKNSAYLRRKLGLTIERKITREGIKIYG
jgi:predicted nucleotidyltransferase